MSLSKTLRLLVLVPLAISPLYGRQDLRTVSAPPVVRYVAPLFGPYTTSPCLPLSVRLSVTIGPAGDVKELLVISGPPALHKPVTEAVRLWLFEPPVVDGKPATVRTEIDVLNHAPDAKCELPQPSPTFSFSFNGVQGQRIDLGGASYSCADCWFIRTESGVGGPVNGGPGMTFRLRSDTNELEFKCRAHECTVKHSPASTIPAISRTLKFDEGGIIPTSARATFTVVK